VSVLKRKINIPGDFLQRSHSPNKRECEVGRMSIEETDPLEFLHGFQPFYQSGKRGFFAQIPAIESGVLSNEDKLSYSQPYKSSGFFDDIVVPSYLLQTPSELYVAFN